MICEYQPDCTRDAYAIVKELSQDQSTLSETPVCEPCFFAWWNDDTEKERWFDKELRLCALDGTMMPAYSLVLGPGNMLVERES